MHDSNVYKNFIGIDNLGIESSQNRTQISGPKYGEAQNIMHPK